MAQLSIWRAFYKDQIATWDEFSKKKVYLFECVSKLNSIQILFSCPTNFSIESSFLQLQVFIAEQYIFFFFFFVFTTEKIEWKQEKKQKVLECVALFSRIYQPASKWAAGFGNKI